MLKCYVAGPDVFRQDALEYLESVREFLASKGLEALIPLDNEVSFDGDKTSIAEAIYYGNIDMIDKADVVLANIQPFRGDHMDPGTAFEIGYAVAKGKKVYAYSTYAHTTIAERIEGNILPNDTHLDVHGMLVEDFNLSENLMITVPAEGVFRTMALAVDLILRDHEAS